VANKNHRFLEFINWQDHASKHIVQSTKDMRVEKLKGTISLLDEQERLERIPAEGRRGVDLYIRTYNTLLQSSSEIKLKTLEHIHCGIDSTLHPLATTPYPDMSALIYNILRVPLAVMQSHLIILGQSEQAFLQSGFPVQTWEYVTASARRRKWLYDGKETLGVYIASVSDMDDIIPVLVAFQIEWNKIHELLHGDPRALDLLQQENTEWEAYIQSTLHIADEAWKRLQIIWHAECKRYLLTIATQRQSLRVRLLNGSHVGYVRETRQWWQAIGEKLQELNMQQRPVYFVSSNTHSIVNLLSGRCLSRERELINWIISGDNAVLQQEYHKLQQGTSASNWQNFLYFVARQWSSSSAGMAYMHEREKEEQERGIWYVPSTHTVEVDAQIIELRNLHLEDIDPRCQNPSLKRLNTSDAILLNIDYPLGMAAYRMLREVMENVLSIRGIYVLGKAATLNGNIGDVMISNCVLDEHSKNIYWIDNCFAAHDVQPYLLHGAVLDNQKAISARGTYLQNRHYLDFFYQENYTVVEMESGPYLDAIYESQYATRYPTGENINFTRLPFELGILHYASDTPFTRGQNLGAGNLSYYGMDSTYACTTAIVRRILEHECLT
jgi:hypothetical protein